MISSPSTWMPIYWGDYLKCTMHLSTEEHGAYLLLICHYWQNGGKIKNDEKIIKNVCKISSKKLQNVLAFFEEKDGFLKHSRIDAELANAVEYKKKQSNRTKAATEARLANAQRDVDVTGDVTLSPSPSPSPVDIDSVTNVTAPDDLFSQTVDFKKVLFTEGLKMLGGDKARSLLGKWIKEYGQDSVVAAMLETQKQGAVEPKGYMEKILRNGKGNQNGKPHFNGTYQQPKTRTERAKEALAGAFPELWEHDTGGIS